MRPYTRFILIAALGVVGISGALLVFRFSTRNELSKQPFVVRNVVAESTGEDSLYDVFLVSSSGEKKKFGSIGQLFIDHLHWYEYREGTLYVIKRVNYGGVDDADWADELWKYNGEGKGVRLYASQGLNFSVSEDGAYIVALAGDSHEIVLFDQDAKQTVFSANQISSAISTSDGESLDFISWNNHELWFETTHLLHLFIAFNAEDQTFQIFDLSDQIINPRDFALNSQKRIVAFSDYPLFFDRPSFEDYEKNPETVTLRVIDLESRKILLERQTLGQPFNPQWIDADTLEIDGGDPFGSVREKIDIAE